MLCEYCTRVRKSILSTIFVFIKSHEKGLITKECIVTDTHLNFALNELYTSVCIFTRVNYLFLVLVIKLFSRGTKLFNPFSCMIFYELKI